MISRRLVRIKTMQNIFAAQMGAEAQPEIAAKQLGHQILKTSDIYLFLLEFPENFKQYLWSERELEIKKYYPDSEKIRLFGALHDNQLITDLYNAAVALKRNQFKDNWESYADRFEQIFIPLKEEDFFKDYLVFEQHNFAQQKEFLTEFYDWLFRTSEQFYQLMEEIYPIWADDEPAVQREINKTLEKTSQGNCKISQPVTLMHEDVQFAMELFKKVLTHQTDFEEDIEQVTHNWDASRIADVDLICMKMAMAEMLYFQDIPLKVSINEYLEIIKDYSTPNSSKFVNGILDKLRINYQQAGRIKKSEKGSRG